MTAVEEVAVVCCARCGEAVADVKSVPYTGEDGRATTSPPPDLVLTTQVKHRNAAAIIGWNTGTRRLTKCRCSEQPCSKPEHISTGASPHGAHIVPDDQVQALLREIAQDAVHAWCSRCGAQTVDLRDLRRRLRGWRRGSGSTLKLRTVPPPTSSGR